MIYKLMSVDAIHSLFEATYDKVGFLTVKFPKSDKLFKYDGKVLSGDRIAVYLQNTGHLVQTSAKELLVQMDHQTYELRRLENDADYELALAVYKQYFDSPVDSEEGRFNYLLSLIIADYESEHYPIASLSTVDFIDTLLEERGLSWSDVQDAIGYGNTVDTGYVRRVIKDEDIDPDDLRALSHFFRLPVQAFIVGGYGG